MTPILTSLVAALMFANSAAQAQPTPTNRSAASSEAFTRFKDGSDTVVDGKTGLIWSKRDNGQDINWSDAKRYCSSRKPGNWELPTMSELDSLFDRSGNLTTPCGGLTCSVSPLFKLSEAFFWAARQSNSVEAPIMYLDDGSRGSGDVSSSGGHRVLCLRAHPRN